MINYRGKELTHFARFWFKIENPHTQTTKREQESIKQYAHAKEVAVEIGVFEGFNTLNIAKVLSDTGKLYAIDPFIKGKIGICYGELISLAYIKRAGLSKKIEFIKGYSFDASEFVPSGVDFIFVDGDHSYEGIKNDWMIWSKKVKRGGVIALHDTSFFGENKSVLQLGSYQYFNESIVKDPEFELLETVDSMNILKRK